MGRLMVEFECRLLITGKIFEFFLKIYIFDRKIAKIFPGLFTKKVLCVLTSPHAIFSCSNLLAFLASLVSLAPYLIVVMADFST